MRVEGGGNFISAVWKSYWFINCIFLYYFIFYFFERFIIHSDIIIRYSVLFLPILISIATALIMAKADGSIFHSDWHYVCHFSVMILGGLTFTYFKNNTLTCRWYDWIGLILSFILYFAVMSLGKGQTDWRYYLQLVCLIPLHTFCWYCYKVCSGVWCKKLFSNATLKSPLLIVSALTLEIYIVQFAIITDKFNNLFPLNILIVFFLICATAYALRVATNTFLQLLNKEPWNWQVIVRLY